MVSHTALYRGHPGTMGRPIQVPGGGCGGVPRVWQLPSRLGVNTRSPFPFVDTQQWDD